MSEHNAAVVRRFVKEYQSGSHDVAVAEELLADDFVDHCPFGTFAPDREPGARLLFAMFFSVFPDFRAEIHTQVSDGDLVTTHKTFSGTHQGEFPGHAPLGHRSELRRDRHPACDRRPDA